MTRMVYYKHCYKKPEEQSNQKGKAYKKKEENPEGDEPRDEELRRSGMLDIDHVA